MYRRQPLSSNHCHRVAVVSLQARISGIMHDGAGGGYFLGVGLAELGVSWLRTIPLVSEVIFYREHVYC